MTEFTANPQYQHKTQWLNRTDGYLVLDKNINGTLDNAEELFSNSSVAEQYRGTASLDKWGAAGDGLINNTDPLYNQLHAASTDENYYKNRSFLRRYLLSCGTKTYLKTGRKCLKLAFSKPKCSLQAQKRVESGIKRRCN